MPLYLVPSPIGNLGDMTYRAVQILQEAEVILCEDTRTSRVLLDHYQIRKPLTPYHQHNEHQVVEHLTDQLAAGRVFALLTDAGTPGISDPGFLLVRACRQKNIRVECLPGATAFVPALVQSGIPSDSFVFEGFLPQKKGRQTMLQQIAAEERTVIVYESPHRLLKALGELAAVLGPDRLVSVSRELTKKFEETRTATAAGLLAHYTAHPPKGEIVIVIAGGPKRRPARHAEEEE